MGLSAKHIRQQTVARYDFTGGLNLTTVAEMIGDNQMAEAVNVEIDRATGSLKTACGAVCIYKSPVPIRALLYDSINSRYLIVSGEDVYRSNLASSVHVGKLTGKRFPVYTAWEDGILIASGGKLQYWNGKRLLTIKDSPENCNGVYIRAGCVFVYHGNEIRHSAVGDEENWTEDNNVDSASKFVEAGYKDGGEIIGLANLSSDVLIIKSNGRVYRLSGEYPNWSIREISRNVDCLNSTSYCAVANSVLILGANKLQAINTSQEYGDMKAVNVAQNVTNLFYRMTPANARLVFVAPLNQVWMLGGARERIVVYDLTFNAFTERQFNSEIVDVVSVNDAVFVVRKDKVTQLEESVFSDEVFCKSEAPLSWRFMGKRMTSYYEYLLKRMRATYIPLDCAGEAKVSVGDIFLKPRPAPPSPLVLDNHELVYGNERLIFPIENYFEDTRCVYRNHYLDVSGSGDGSPVILLKIEFDVAEV